MPRGPGKTFPLGTAGHLAGYDDGYDNWLEGDSILSQAGHSAGYDDDKMNACGSVGKPATTNDKRLASERPRRTKPATTRNDDNDSTTTKP
jgi:hypothetical protein